MDLLHIFVNVVLMSTTAFAQKRRSDPSDRPYLGRKDTHQYALGGYADGWRWYKVEGNGNKVGSSNIESMNLYLIVIETASVIWSKIYLASKTRFRSSGILLETQECHLSSVDK